MAETATKPTLVKPDAGPETDGKDGGGDRLGRALDVTAVVAAVALGVIIFDMLSGGRITRALRKKRGGCGCQDEQEGPSGDG